MLIVLLVLLSSSMTKYRTIINYLPVQSVQSSFLPLWTALARNKPATAALLTNTTIRLKPYKQIPCYQ